MEQVRNTKTTNTIAGVDSVIVIGNHREAEAKPLDLNTKRAPPPPPTHLQKLRPYPSYSWRRDRVNLVPNLVRYQMLCSHIRHGFDDEFASASYIETQTHFLGVFAHLNPHISDFGDISALYPPFLHQLTMRSSFF